MKFKVGDRIVVIKHNRYYGRIGIVLQVHLKYVWCKVKLDDGAVTLLFSDSLKHFNGLEQILNEI